MSDSGQRFWRDPLLPHVESRVACNSRAAYKAHSHATFSIGAIDTGLSQFTDANNRVTLLQPGCLVFVPPDCVHACNPVPAAGRSYQMLHLDAQWLETWRSAHLDGTNGPPSSAIWLTDEPALYQSYCQLNRLLFSEATPATKDGALKAFLASIRRPAPPNQLESTRLRAGVECQSPSAVEAMMKADLDENSVQQVAQRFGMSPSQFIRAFRSSTGLTPHAWRLNRRINQARIDLRAGQDIASTAHQHGFADQSHFHRTFTAFMAITPGQYKKMG